MKVFAHRGLSSKFPENTLEAFKEALKYNIAGVETDVQLTKDNKMVIIHDEMVDRTTNGKGFVKDYTLEQLKALNANNHFEGNYQIPTLDEFLDLFKDNDVIINLELKTSIFEYKGIEQMVYDCIIKHNLKDRIIISSFNHESLLRVKEIDSTIKVGLLTGERIIDVENYMIKYNIDYYHPAFYLIKPERVAYLHNHGKEVNVWTVDERIYFDMLVLANVDVIMTNKCDEFARKTN